MHELGNEINRFGTATFCEAEDVRRAGMFEQRPDSLFVGYFGGRPIWYSDMGGALLVAGARGGKLRDILAYNLCPGILQGVNLVTLDMKGECAAISQNQTADGKFNIYWNPSALHGLQQHRINPVDYLRLNNPNLVSDVKVFCENMIPLSGAAQNQYFERRAREFLEAIVLTLVRINGRLTLPNLYRTINLIPAGEDDWLDFGYEMTRCGFPIAERIEEEIAESRDNPVGGFQGILGEIFKAFSALSDPTLMDSVSPRPDGSFDFSLSQLCESGQLYQLYLMPPAEFVEAWSSVIKAIFVGAMIYKSRKPQAAQQTWIIDECAQLGAFPLVTKLYTYGAGIGIRPLTVWQSTYQMNALGPSAENIITSSAALRIYFAVRDIQSATAVSKALGAQTLSYDDEAKQAAARLAKEQALQSLLNGEDPFAAGLNYAHHKQEATRQTKQHRLLRTPDEVINTPAGRMYLFTDTLPKPLYGERKAYYEQRLMAGRYYPNPYHPPLDQVRVKTAFGHKWRRIINERVPTRFANYPQYRGGFWSRIEGVHQ